MNSFRPDGTIDPALGRILTFLGAKRSGKSVAALLYFMSYPGDKIVIDVAGDDGPVGPDVVEIRGTVGDGTIPDRWPEHLRKYDSDGRPIPMILRFVPDHGSKDPLADMDAVVALAVNTPRPLAILIHEIQIVAAANRTPPNMRRLLNHNRHGGATTVLMCGPRSVGVDPLVVSQADLLFVFKMPNVNDRKRIAQNIAVDPNELDVAVMGLGPHEYIRYDVNETRDDFQLLAFPALPKSTVDKVQAWADGSRPRRVKEAW